jgi:hypothetical protein
MGCAQSAEIDGAAREQGEGKDQTTQPEEPWEDATAWLMANDHRDDTQEDRLAGGEP